MLHDVTGPHAVLVEICVSERGDVLQITTDHRAAPALEQVVTSAIRTWRYRPLMVSGQPRPFCHAMQINYLTS